MKEQSIAVDMVSLHKNVTLFDDGHLLAAMSFEKTLIFVFQHHPSNALLISQIKSICPIVTK